MVSEYALRSRNPSDLPDLSSSVNIASGTNAACDSGEETATQSIQRDHEGAHSLLALLNGNTDEDGGNGAHAGGSRNSDLEGDESHMGTRVVEVTAASARQNTSKKRATKGKATQSTTQEAQRSNRRQRGEVLMHVRHRLGELLSFIRHWPSRRDSECL